MVTTHTAETLRALIERSAEPDTAEHVLAALKLADGQLITTRLLDKLPGGRVEWRLQRNFGWTQITNRAYLTSQGSSRDGVSLILVRSEAAVPLSAAWVEAENPAYFAGRRERNKQRANAVTDHSRLTRLAFVMNEIEHLNHQLREAKKAFAGWVDEPPFSAVKYDLERACGLREDK